MQRRLVIALLVVGCTQPPSAEQSAPGPTQKKDARLELKTPTTRPAPPRPVAAAGAPVGAPIPAFVADVIPAGGGVPAKVDSANVARPTAFVMLGTSCPATAAYAERLVELEKAYKGKTDFVYIYPNAGDTAEMKASFHEDKGFAGGHVDDRGGRIARMLGAKRTSEVYLTDAKGTLVYKGAVDDHRDAARVTRRHLAMAIDETLAGGKVTTPTTDVHA